MPTDIEKQLQESAKIAFDYFKHLTTLSTGSIVLLGTLMDRLIESPSWKPLIYVSFTAFLITVLASVSAMYSLCYLTSPTQELTSPEDRIADKVLGAGSVLAAAAFVLAVGALAAFFIRNT